MATRREWRLRRRPVGAPTDADLELVTQPMPEPADGEFLARTLWLSLDPTHRISMSDRTQYAPPVQIGEVIGAGSLSQIVASRAPGFEPGDIIRGRGGWTSHWIGRQGSRIDPSQGALTDHLSLLGMTGATAYFGLLDVGRPQPGETVVVSAAAGAVGSIVGQIARIKGCRVVGIAGSEEKCAHVVATLGFDACVSHRSPTLAEDLAAACPNGIDVDFENVGGAVLDAILPLMNLHGRIVVCGLISTYNSEGPVIGPKHFDLVLMHRLRVQGMLVSDFLDRLPEATADLARWKAEGLIHQDLHLVEGGIEKAPEALDVILSGGNTGKVLLHVADPD